jgi:Flp pilus assembly protein TadD
MPSAKSASLLRDIGLLYAKFGDQAQAVHYTRTARAKAPSDVQLMYSEGHVYALLGQPVKAIPAYRQAIAKGYSRKEVRNDPENAKLQSFPEFVKLVKSCTSK